MQLPVIEVFDQDGHNHAATAFARGRDVSAKVRKLPTGAYTVRWHVLSSDGHVVSGVWTFGVRVKAPPPTEAYGASGPTRTEHVVRWLYFVALALVIGALGFRLILLRGLAVPPAVDKRLLLLAVIGAAGVLEVGIAAFLLRCEDVLQLPFGKFLYGDLSPISGGTRYGKTFVAVTLGFALVAAFIYLAWLLDRPRLLVPALALAVFFAGGLSFSGHDAVDPGSSWKSELADWVHLSAVSLWIGGLVALAVVWRAAPALQREFFARFSRFATVLVALVLAAGTYLAIVRLPHLHDLWRYGYGQVLLVKLALVARRARVGWRASLLRAARDRGERVTVFSRASAEVSPGRWRSGSRCCSSRRCSPTRSRRLSRAARAAGPRMQARSARPRGGSRRTREHGDARRARVGRRPSTAARAAGCSGTARHRNR